MRETDRFNPHLKAFPHILQKIFGLSFGSVLLLRLLTSWPSAYRMAKTIFYLPSKERVKPIDSVYYCFSGRQEQRFPQYLRAYPSNHNCFHYFACLCPSSSFQHHFH